MGLLKSKSVCYKRNNKYLHIFPTIPYWLVVNDKMNEILNLLQEFDELATVIQVYLERFGGNENDVKKAVSLMYTRLENHKVLEEIKNITESWTGFIESAGINITSKCNLHCSYCYYNAGEVDRDEIELVDIKKYLDGVKKFSNDKCYVQFTGGEPLLRRELLFAAIEYARMIGLPHITINTNGILLDEEICDYFSKYRVDNVTVSLDGVDSPIHDQFRGMGSFEKAERAIRILKQYGVKVTASMTIHKGTFGELQNFVQYCRNENISVFTSPLFPVGRALESIEIEHVGLDQLYRTIAEWYSDGLFTDKDLNGTFFQTIILPLRDLTRRRYCGAALSTVFMDVDGSIYPCTNTVGIQQFKGGNIQLNTFEEIWLGSAELSKVRNEISVEKMEPCKECEVRYICGGFCRGVTYKITNDINAPFIWCEEIRSAIIEGMWTIGNHPKVYEGAKNEFKSWDVSFNVQD